ncbi:hypothetical protein QMK19_06815 [Streptomyces sp. H10-C2]|uniref:hypothetical protein n=1 Tax=unclassified Streptomyces TaxID=2593676 RepID=UPI0024BA9D8F|nr:MULTISPECIES: hypothetical protein [unclassified Streptomyces]MDJ0339970.1 hypothetical protein [Streptomyces sp. PH10-H1]MDJ0369393.1 hypothetical protein [Streptomyces sp. H10-C2]
MTVTPGKTWPGAVISLHVKSACKAGNRAKASAEVFVNAVTLAPPTDGQDGLVSDASIKSDVAPGTYTVSVECDGNSHAAEGTVVVMNATPERPAPTWPTSPVPAGGGGTAQLAAGPASAGPGEHAVTLAGAAAAAGLAGVALYRRRRRG